MWKTTGCAVIGRGHEKEGLPCQDQVAFAAGGGIAAAVLADGAGSAKMAEEGAICAAKIAANYLVAHFHEILADDDATAVKEQLLATLKHALQERAEELDGALRGLASTLLAVAADGEQLLIVHLGDGVIGYLKEGELRVVSAPDNGEFANVTTFVTSPDALVKLRIYRGGVENVEGIVLMSDGTEQSFYQKQQRRLMPRLVHVMREAALVDNRVFVPQLVDAMTTVVTARTQDDCSIALLVRAIDEENPLAGKDDAARMEAFGIVADAPCARRRLRLCDEIYGYLAKPRTERAICRRFHIRFGAKKKLARLLAKGYIVKNGDIYQRACAARE